MKMPTSPPINPFVQATTHQIPSNHELYSQPQLHEHFTALIHIHERYPFVEPGFFYEGDNVLCHVNVNPNSRLACLYERWQAVHTLVDCVERFITQISYLGFDPTIYEGTGAAAGGGRLRGPGWPHVLNQGALDWSKALLARDCNAFPFRNERGEGPPALVKPGSQTEAIGPLEIIDIDLE